MAAKNDQPALERVTHRPRILSLLQQVFESRTILTVHLPEDNNRYTSALLGINEDADSLLLDELNPKQGHDRLIKTKQMNISARLAGVNIYFKSNLLSVAQENGIALYRVPVPERLLYEQKRGAFRVRVGAGMHIPLALRNEESTLQGYLTDVSSTGAGALLEAEDNVAIGTIFEYSLGPAEGFAVISGALEIRFCKFDEQTKLYRLGCQFVNQAHAQIAQMERFVMGLQREVIKRSKNL